jgi:hypothetical protein
MKLSQLLLWAGASVSPLATHINSQAGLTSYVDAVVDGLGCSQLCIQARACTWAAFDAFLALLVPCVLVVLGH